MYPNFARICICINNYIWNLKSIFILYWQTVSCDIFLDVLLPTKLIHWFLLQHVVQWIFFLFNLTFKLKHVSEPVICVY